MKSDSLLIVSYIKDLANFALIISYFYFYMFEKEN